MTPRVPIAIPVTGRARYRDGPGSAPRPRRRRISERLKPLVLLDPAPRTAAEIFSPACRARLDAGFEVVERAADEAVAAWLERFLPRAHFLVGQSALDAAALERAPELRAIVNVEGNFLPNVDYAACFRRGVRVLTISPVFAQPVAELAVGLTLALARDIPAAHRDFVEGRERYGLDGNRRARLLRGATLGFVGFGDLGRAVLEAFAGFRCRVLVHDPWLSPEALEREGLTPVALEELLGSSDVVQVVATVTDESRGLIGAGELALMKPDALLVLLSRAAVVDFPALVDACRAGRLRAATDVFPEEPLAADDPLRTTPNLLLSAHRAGALESALLEIGERTVADLELMARGLPPQNCKRAEPELVGRLRSRPVERS